MTHRPSKSSFSARKASVWIVFILAGCAGEPGTQSRQDSRALDRLEDTLRAPDRDDASDLPGDTQSTDTRPDDSPSMDISSELSPDALGEDALATELLFMDTPGDVALDLRLPDTIPDDLVTVDASSELPRDSGGPEASPSEVPPAGDSGAPVDVVCARPECGISCFDPRVCGACGNGACDATETPETCAADCCDARRCDPSLGTHSPSGDARCAASAEGTRCDDGDLSNGIEICRGGRCLQEHRFCRCLPPGGAYPVSAPDPADFALPTAPTDPTWSGTPPSEESLAGAWALHRIDLSRAWERTRGRSDVLVAIVDTGCDPSTPDLMGQIVGQRDLIDADDTAQDDNGHGTALASLVAARVDGTGIVGVAPDVRILCVRVADEQGRATYDHVAAGIRWATMRRAQVILVGVGGTGPHAELALAVRDAIAMDAVVLAPAGSGGGSNLELFPAALPGVVSVAASDAVDEPSEDGDIGPRTWVLAPGEQVQTALPGVGGGTELRDGSSVAAGLVAGVVALMRSADGSLSSAQVRGILRQTGRPVPIPDFERAFIARRVDAASAVRAASASRANVAVGRVAFPSPSGLPGEISRVRVRVDNRGAVEARAVVLTVTPTSGRVSTLGGAPGTTATATIPAIAVGESAEMDFAVTPEAGASRVSLEARAALAETLCRVTTR